MSDQPLDDTAAPAAPRVLTLCPHCSEPLERLGWMVAEVAQGTVYTFFHESDTCMTALNSQLVPREIQRIVAPSMWPRPS